MKLRPVPRSLSAWSVRRVALVWLCGIGLQATLLRVLAEPAPPDPPRVAVPPGRAEAARPLPPAVRDSLLVMLRDRGVDARLDPAGRVAAVAITDTTTARLAGETLGGVLRGVQRAMIEILQLLFALPALLLGFTFVWARARRRARRGIEAPAV